MRVMMHRFKRVLRKGDLLGHIEGRGIVLIMTGVTQRTALAMAERIQSEVTRPFAVDGCTPAGEFSIHTDWYSEAPAEPIGEAFGVAERPQEGGRDLPLSRLAEQKDTDFSAV